MANIPKKEYKFVECFKSVMDGSCNWCKIRLWNKGNKIYAMKKPDGKWLACTDRKCYLEQGGKLTEFNGTKPIQPKAVTETICICTHCTHPQGGEEMLHIGDIHYHRTCYNTIVFQATFLENWK